MGGECEKKKKTKKTKKSTRKKKQVRKETPALAAVAAASKRLAVVDEVVDEVTDMSPEKKKNIAKKHWRDRSCSPSKRKRGRSGGTYTSLDDVS